MPVPPAPHRYLRQQDRREQQRAAAQFPGAQGLVQDDPSGQDGKDRFQAHEQRSHGGMQALLADDLQGIAYAAGQDSRVEEGDPGLGGGQYSAPAEDPGGRVVHIAEKGGDQTDDPAYQKLDAGTNPEAVKKLTDLVDDLCLGYKLPGAGGGGYLYMMAKDPEAALKIRRILKEHRPNDRARFVEMSLQVKIHIQRN